MRNLQNHRPNRRTDREFRSPTRAVALALVACVSSWAGAQINRVEPFFAVVTVDQTSLHAGDMPLYYAVARLDAGAVLRVDGAGAGWSRVTYPAGVTSYATAREVKDLGDGKLEVIRTTPLKAANADRGFGGSWQNLLPAGAELEPGAVLSYTEPVKRSDGSIAAYIVTPPESARAYVESSLLRKATNEEVEAFLKATGAVPPAQEEPVATAPPAENNPTPVVSEPTEEVISLIDDMQVTGEQTRPSTPVVSPIVTPVVTPVETPANAPIATDPVESTTNVVTDAEFVVPPVDNDPIEVLPADPPADSAPATSLPDPAETAAEVARLNTMIDASLDVEALEASFASVRTQPLMEAELGELRNQFQRVRDSLSATPVDQVIASRIDQRLAVLDVMIDLRDRRRELAAQQTSIDTTTIEIQRRIEATASRAAYSVVGQLVPSSIYDGLRLPKLYRIVSVDQTGTRTIAYVADREDLQLAEKVGRVVGFTGSIGLDPTLGVRLVNTNNASVLLPGG